MFGRFSKILVVDDSLVQRKIMRGMLNGMGFENIDEAHNGRVALAMLGAHAYRLVLSDWDMPDMNGVDLLDAMRADPRLRRIPFVMVTAHAKRFGDVARDAGVTHFLTKPFTADALAARIAMVTKSDAA